ncbi:MAG: hypothetical protein QXU67_04180 [Candidatus Bathyarchaeia archaeon]
MSENEEKKKYSEEEIRKIINKTQDPLEHFTYRRCQHLSSKESYERMKKALIGPMTRLESQGKIATIQWCIVHLYIFGDSNDL